MIQLECSNCRTMLSIDDAFAGGVCRCQFCGTIQTVPKPSQKTSLAAGDANSPKALFKRKARIESALSPYNDGLARAVDEMEAASGLSSNLAGLHAVPKRSAAPNGDSSAGAQAIGSSGAGVPSPRRSSPVEAASSGSHSNGSTAGRSVVPAAAVATANPPAGKPHFVPKPSTAHFTASPDARHPARTPVIIGAAVAGVLLCGGGLWWALSGRSKPVHHDSTAQSAPVPPKVEPASAPVPVANADPTAVAAPGPQVVPVPVVVVPLPIETPVVAPGEPGSLSGISLSGTRVVYILDRSGCTQQAFGQMLDACYGSIQSLGQGRKFGLIVWNNTQDLSFPPQDLVPASATNLDECKKLVVDTYAGTTDIGTILAKAVGAKAAEIVLMSAVDLDDATAMAIRDELAKAEGGVKFHAVAVGTDLTAERLKPLVADYAGQFKQVDLATLK